MKQRLRCSRLVASAMIAGSLTVVMMGISASAALASGPLVTLANNADGSGVFAQTENVAKTAVYPDTVTFQITITAPPVVGPDGKFPKINFVSDTQGADLTSCNSPSGVGGVQLTASQTVTCTYTLTLSGPQSTAFSDGVTVNYSGGGKDLRSATSTIEFPGMTLSKSSTTQFVGAIGQVVPYTYTVTNTGTSLLTGITLSDNNTDSAPSCPSTTLGVGLSMTCTAQHTVTASDLTGTSLDNLATASSNEAPDATATYSIPVIPTLGGDFVIGDLTYGAANGTSTPVNFWGAQWWKNNSLSGGTGPAAFKGFEDSPAAPTCGQNWTSDPGNSTPPPAGPLPPDIAVIVSSTVTQTGSTIGGDTQHVIVVQTNSGYQGNPGHPGWGPIVATLC